MRGRLNILIFLLPVFILWMYYPQVVFAQRSLPSATTLTPVLTEIVPNSLTPNTPGGITEPKNGASLRGSVSISGTATAGWILTFSYAENSAETWYPLAHSGKHVSKGILAIWDTRNVTDGLYYVRLSVLTEAKQDYLVKIRVSNNTPIDTETPTQPLTKTLVSVATLTPASFSIIEKPKTETITPTFGPLSTDESTELGIVTPTSLAKASPVPAKNPATLDPKDIFINLGKGIIAIIVVFALIGLIFFLRHR
jgi:hypothetical protein